MRVILSIYVRVVALFFGMVNVSRLTQKLETQLYSHFVVNKEKLYFPL